MRYIFLLVATVLVVSSCDKVEVPASKQEMLRNGQWMLTSGSTKVYNAATKKYDTTAIVIDECKKDDRLVFRENYDGVHTPGENRCNASETAEMPFRWGLLDDDRKMYIYDGKSFFNLDVNAEVKEFTEGSFTITYNQYTTVDNVPRTDTVMYTMTFKKI
ncbi:MAG: hypothetical protein R2800_06885 [Flavipsychrobacter sp.]